MDFLDVIPQYVFELIGTFAGLAACLVIAIQIVKEYRSPEQSSLSTTYTVGWGIIFFFWFLYGVRFDAIALWLTNAVAVILQAILYVVTREKKR